MEHHTISSNTSFLPQLSKEHMKDNQVISTNVDNSGRLYFGSSTDKSYMWNNLIIEKRISLNWLHRLYEDSIFHDFVLIFSSPVH